MPQLIPFNFIHILLLGIITISILIYISCRYIIPSIVKLYLSRVIITKI